MRDLANLIRKQLADSLPDPTPNLIEDTYDDALAEADSDLLIQAVKDQDNYWMKAAQVVIDGYGVAMNMPSGAGKTGNMPQFIKELDQQFDKFCEDNFITPKILSVVGSSNHSERILLTNPETNVISTITIPFRQSIIPTKNGIDLIQSFEKWLSKLEKKIKLYQSISKSTKPFEFVFARQIPVVGTAGILNHYCFYATNGTVCISIQDFEKSKSTAIINSLARFNTPFKLPPVVIKSRNDSPISFNLFNLKEKFNDTPEM